VASLVLGITSIVFCWWGLFTLVQVVLAVVFGGVAIRAANQGADRKGMAIAGLVCGVVGFAAYALFGISTLGIGFLV
jgi:ABC-type phosphate transport system permease subunit